MSRTIRVVPTVINMTGENLTVNFKGGGPGCNPGTKELAPCEKHVFEAPEGWEVNDPHTYSYTIAFYSTSNPSLSNLITWNVGVNGGDHGIKSQEINDTTSNYNSKRVAIFLERAGDNDSIASDMFVIAALKG